jgi:hypothetical protein
MLFYGALRYVRERSEESLGLIRLTPTPLLEYTAFHRFDVRNARFNCLFRGARGENVVLVNA